MKTDFRVGYHFIVGKTLYSRIIQLFGWSRVSHVFISLTDDFGTVYYNCARKMTTAWFDGDTPVVPYDSVYEDLSLCETSLDKVLPPDEPYNFGHIVWYYLTGRPKDPLNCVSSVHRLRRLANRTTKGRTPGGIYRHLRQELSDQR